MLLSIICDGTGNVWRQGKYVFKYDQKRSMALRIDGPPKVPEKLKHVFWSLTWRSQSEATNLWTKYTKTLMIIMYVHKRKSAEKKEKYIIIIWNILAKIRVGAARFSNSEIWRQDKKICEHDAATSYFRHLKSEHVAPRGGRGHQESCTDLSVLWFPEGMNPIKSIERLIGRPAGKW